MKSRVLFVVLALICARVATAPGQPVDALKKAQSAFDQAQIDYLQQKYDEAAQGFQDAYAARDFPQFLYNAGACFHMKGKAKSDVESYVKAIELYKKYLDKDPKAADKAKVEKAIGVLENEIKRVRELQAKAQTGSGSGSGSDAGSGAGSGSGQVTTVPVGDEVKALGDVKVRGLVVIESEPQNATIYLDSEKKGAFAQTPWSGTLEGEHKIIIEKRGYMVSDSTLQADPQKLLVLRAILGPSNNLAWVDITSNVVGAEIYIDDKTVGAIAHTPHGKNIKPGKHTFWITAEGYDEYKEEVDLPPGTNHEIKATLKGSPVGKINVIGLGIEDSTIYLDGKLACERGPCLKPLTQGDHTVTVTRPGMKTYSRRVNIQAKTETSIKVTLAPKPSRGDAVVAYVLAAGFGGGGVFLGLQANKYRDEIKKGIADGTTGTNVPVDNNDPRFFKGKAFAIGADAAFALAGITALTAIYYTFRDKGAPSTGLIDVRALALQPQLGKDYAGLGMEVHW